MLHLLTALSLFASADPLIDEAGRAAAATIQVRCLDTGVTATGVVIGRQAGYYFALTAEHVIRKSNKVEVVSSRSGEKADFVTFKNAEILWIEIEPDLALIQFPAGDVEIKPLPIAQRGGTLKKVPLLAAGIGWPPEKARTMEQDQALAKKLVKRSDGGSAFYWETKGIPEQGRSGGPLIDVSGKLIGICSGSQEGKGYYTHLDEIVFGLKRYSSSKWLVPADLK